MFRIPLLAALCSVVSAELFTKPEAGALLNVSSLITIAWNQPERPRDDFNYLNLEMHFSMPHPNNTDGMIGWTENLASNLTLSRGGEYQWDPTEVKEFIEESYNETDTRGKPVVTFYATLKGPSDGLTKTSKSDEFHIAEYSSAVRAAVPVWLVVVASLLVTL
ncbi:hypothetical protein LIA77_03631 [Sarocladium implicatum]|nr:hypothetical protein LIA77_03631 [Sarocladium implicatum]